MALITSDCALRSVELAGLAVESVPLHNVLYRLQASPNAQTFRG